MAESNGASERVRGDGAKVTSDDVDNLIEMLEKIKPGDLGIEFWGFYNMIYRIECDTRPSRDESASVARMKMESFYRKEDQLKREERIRDQISKEELDKLISIRKHAEIEKRRKLLYDRIISENPDWKDSKVQKEIRKILSHRLGAS